MTRQHFSTTNFFTRCAYTGILVFSSMFTSTALQAAETVAKSYDIRNVTEIVAGGGVTLKITQGKTESLRAEANKDLMEYVSVDLTGNRLTLGLKSKTNGRNFFNWIDSKNGDITFILQVKDLNYVELNGSVQASLGGFTGKNLDTHMSGASDIIFAALKLESLTMDLSGASEAHVQQLEASKLDVELSGASNFDVRTDSKVKDLTVEASGASNFHGKLLASVDADVKASGASNIDVNAASELSAEASGVSNINYLGKAELKSHSTGSSNIKAFR